MIGCTRAEALISIPLAMYCLRFLEANKITHIVNLAADGPNAPETVKNNEVFRDRPDFVYYSINVGDQIEGAVALMQALRGGCLKFIFDALKDGHRVLCHCHKVSETTFFCCGTKSLILINCTPNYSNIQGVSRSATACVAYLVEYKKMSLDDAFAMCKKSRQCVKVNSGFMSALQQQYGDANLE